ncbi:MAG: transcriptional repressor LexA [Planctomycetota bacterium]
MSKLTQKQRAVLDRVQRHLDREGVTPTVREIAQALKIDPKSVAQHLDRLERKGCIVRRPRESRNIRITPIYARDAQYTHVPHYEGECDEGDDHDEGDYGEGGRGDPGRNPGKGLPLVGRIAAGRPILAEENLEAHIQVSGLFGPEGEVFLLRIQGDSMIDVGICDGDMVAVRAHDEVGNGDIAAVLVNGEATVKRLYREGNLFRLEPENKAFRTLVVDAGKDEVRIAGRVAGLIRKMA